MGVMGGKINTGKINKSHPGKNAEKEKSYTTRKTNFDFENSDLENYKSENSNIYLEIQSIILALGNEIVEYLNKNKIENKIVQLEISL